MRQVCSSHADAAPGFDLASAAVALHQGDVDAALEAGLLEWPACAACARAAALDEASIALLLEVRKQRQQALAARDRHRARLSRLDAERMRRQPPAEAVTILPSAAAEALTPRSRR